MTVDVLVLGGGPAGTWAALRAAAAGASVALADKGFCGSSGATAAAGTGIWYVRPDPELRERAMASREALGGYLADRDWMARVLDETYARVDELAEVGRYPFPVDRAGRPVRTGVQGPEYMRRQRIRVQRAEVRVLDHAPAIELLTDADGSAAGARLQRLATGELIDVPSRAVVLATGGCAFLSKTLGCNVNTGDGALMAVEAGAELSGMEFSNAYAIAPEFTSVTKTAYYSFATFYQANGEILAGASGKSRSPIARALASGPVYCTLDRADAEQRRAMRLGQPNFFLTFDRLGIDPFTDRFPITLLLEGTVRGTGGVRVAGADCSTSVPGLYVAGDVATRELICGGFTGGGSHNAAWAMSSGSWAGAGAAEYARLQGDSVDDRQRFGAGGVGLRPTGRPDAELRPADLVAVVQREVLPYDKNYLRHGDRLRPALATLHDAWRQARTSLTLTQADPSKVRSAAAMIAHARWMYTAALARTESRGMARREEFPDIDPAQHHRLITGGLDEVWTAPEPVFLAESRLVPA
ncbi:succinate dehydrogenase/fumarate reductase flavoprotein subunit [Nocardia tenerifensis]|uniref:L-aspartate oxidase n=1 Tax=Nocardia tenerifensis TaxID=228006 RepID=A0A318K4G0_9NOCA|nr:FAD-binding protein [Nocardia tenerifensis]PXX64286.1 succinate dehydrogenase/fumarate reductase flavoprotein subunit [Nocardia tenerifensis]